VKVLELFCGTKSFTKVAEARGHECRTLDNDSKFNPTYCMDIMDFEPSILKGWHPDVVWASPPCQCFSVMVISKNWEKKLIGKNPRPKRQEAVIAMDVATKTTNLIAEIAPEYWFIENPRGMLRKMPFMRGWHKSTVTYCKYGLKYQKATDIWNNCYEWKPRPVCSPRNPCSVRIQKLSTKGHPAWWKPLNKQPEGFEGYRRLHLHPRDMGDECGWSAQALRAIVPEQLCKEILVACEKGVSVSAIDASATTLQVTEVTEVTTSLRGNSY
jgi:hypothetical protein